MKSVFLVLAGLLILSSCGKKSSEPTAAINCAPGSTAAGCAAPGPAPAPVVEEILPEISFVSTEVAMNAQLKVQLELQLKTAGKTAVVATVKLMNGSAVHHRDFIGFKTKYPINETEYTVVIPPGTLKVQLPPIGGRHTLACDTVFYAKIDLLTLEKARSHQQYKATISVPCSVALPWE